MVSKAIASLNAWLARAEEVLSGQREHALSPSETVWDRNQERTTITLARLADGLETLLEALCTGPGRWILIVEPARKPHLFWQALAFEDGSLVTEVVSNRYLEENQKWTPAQEEWLLALGWEPPEQPKRPNWLNIEATFTPDVEQVVRRAMATLRLLFGLEEEDDVLVKMFSSPNRGDTPASAEYAEPEAIETD